MLRGCNSDSFEQYFPSIQLRTLTRMRAPDQVCVPRSGPDGAAEGEAVGVGWVMMAGSMRRLNDINQVTAWTDEVLN